MTRRVTIEELAAWLRARDGFALIGHVSPDGDAAGSCVAMAMALLVIENTHLREVIRNLRDTISGLTDHKLL